MVVESSCMETANKLECATSGERKESGAGEESLSKLVAFIITTGEETLSKCVVADGTFSPVTGYNSGRKKRGYL